MTTIIDLPKSKSKTKLSQFLDEYYRNDNFTRALVPRQKQLKKEEDDESQSSEQG